MPRVADALPMRARRLEIAWVLFVVAVAVSMPLIGRWLPISFHLAWVSLALVYGYVVWSVRTTAVVLVLMTAVTGGMLVWAVRGRLEDVPELTEIPMMVLIFGAMFWHVRRRQHAMEAVRQGQEREREFVRDASHQLRTPITIARGHAELVRAALRDGEAAARDLDVILGELERLSKLADRLLLLAAAEHDDFLHRQRVSFEQIVLDASRRWTGAADRRWATDVRAHGTMEVDADRMAAALDAVLENAVDFTQAGDRITIAADASGSTATVQITDTGAGIPADHAARVFDRFFHASTPEAPRSSTGLGLPIVKAIVEAHGGSAAVESEPGVGTTVRIALPDFRPLPPRAATAPDATTRSMPGRP